MKGDRVEAVVDTGQGVQTFDIVATKAGRRIEVVTTRGVVEVREVTRSGNPVRTARFMATRLVALVEHPAADERGRVEISTSHKLGGRRGPPTRYRDMPSIGIPGTSPALKSSINPVRLSTALAASAPRTTNRPGSRR